MKCPHCAIGDCVGCLNFAGAMIERSCTCRHDAAMPRYCGQLIADEYGEPGSCDLIAGHTGPHMATAP